LFLATNSNIPHFATVCVPLDNQFNNGVREKLAKYLSYSHQVATYALHAQVNRALDTPILNFFTSVTLLARWILINLQEQWFFGALWFTGRTKMVMRNQLKSRQWLKRAVKRDSKPETACFMVSSKSINVSYISNSKVGMGPKGLAHQTSRYSNRKFTSLLQFNAKT